MGAGLALISIFPLLIVFIGTRERTEYQQQPQPKLKASIAAAFKNRPFLFALGIFMLTYAALDIVQSTLLYFLKHHMHLESEGSSRAHILREIDRSLKRLNCDYVDLYYLHRPYPAVPIAESIQAMNDLIDAGKVRYWAISNFSAEQISEVLRVCDEGGWRRPVALQPAYSLLKRDIEQTILPLCEREQLAVIPYQVLQGGLLSGKYQRDLPVPTGSRHTEKPEWLPAFNAELFDQLDRLTAEAAGLNRTLFQHALLALLDQPTVASLIIGVKRIAQLEDALQALA